MFLLVWLGFTSVMIMLARIRRAQRKANKPASSEVRCPYCSNNPKAGAVVCASCGRTLPPLAMRGSYWNALLQDPTLAAPEKSVELEAAARVFFGYKLNERQPTVLDALTAPPMLILITVFVGLIGFLIVVITSN